jgi:BirA family transcriptional regulator, biotin operon repressor / biotin---[acetyl-CoA-carboxylase] ligase
MFTGMTAPVASYTVSGTRFGVRWVAETGSTNADLLADARAGGAEGAVLVADHQTAGRGRLGRTWEAPAGAGLLFSVLLRPTLPAEATHLVTTALGLAALDALPGLPAGLKWPNDLVLATPDGERKLAGILAESVIEGDRVTAVVVGMGINVAWGDADGLPAEIRALGVALDEAGVVVERRSLLDAVLGAFEKRYAALADEAGRAVLVADYRDACVTLGRGVRVELAGETLEGDAVDIGGGGELVVEPAGGGTRVSVLAGDVVHVR